MPLEVSLAVGVVTANGHGFNESVVCGWRDEVFRVLN